MSDALLREMKELRQRSDAMEKRLRDVEIDNAVRPFVLTWVNKVEDCLTFGNNRLCGATI